jgi:hypothetical protein
MPHSLTSLPPTLRLSTNPSSISNVGLQLQRHIPLTFISCRSLLLSNLNSYLTALSPSFPVKPSENCKYYRLPFPFRHPLHSTGAAGHRAFPASRVCLLAFSRASSAAQSASFCKFAIWFSRFQNPPRQPDSNTPLTATSRPSTATSSNPSLRPAAPIGHSCLGRILVSKQHFS